MTSTPVTPSSKGWSDVDKIDILFQIIAKMDKPVPWKEIAHPNGRPLKAVQVDKEKSKLRRAKEAAATGEDGETAIVATPVSKGKKRSAKATDADDDDEPIAKKSKTSRKKKANAAVDEEFDGQLEDEDSEIKAEPADGGLL